MTIINHTHRLIFVHVPKNAGTSVSHYLSQLTTYRDQEIGATALGESGARHYRRRFKLHKHSTLSEIMLAVGDGPARDYRTIAVTRDPVDRVRSVYSFLRMWDGWTRAGTEYHDRRAQFEAFRSVDDFVASDLFQSPGPDRLFMPQMTWLEQSAGAGIGVDHIIRYEHLSEDVGQTVDLLGVPAGLLAQPIGHANASRSDGAAVLRPAMIERIWERYQQAAGLLAQPIGHANASRSDGAAVLRPATIERIWERYQQDQALSR